MDSSASRACFFGTKAAKRSCLSCLCLLLGALDGLQLLGKTEEIEVDNRATNHPISLGQAVRKRPRCTKTVFCAGVQRCAVQLSPCLCLGAFGSAGGQLLSPLLGPSMALSPTSGSSDPLRRSLPRLLFCVVFVPILGTHSAHASSQGSSTWALGHLVSTEDVHPASKTSLSPAATFMCALTPAAGAISSSVDGGVEDVSEDMG